MRLLCAAVVAMSLLVTALPVVPVWAAPAGGSDPAASPVKPVPSRPLAKAAEPQVPPESRLPAASWPAPGAAVVDLPAAAAPSAAFTRGRVPRGTVAPGKESGRVRAGALPVFVSRPAARGKLRSADEGGPAAADAPAKVRVDVLYWTSTPFYNTADPGSGAVNPAPENLSRTATLYDALERPTFTGFYTPTESPKWSTTTRAVTGYDAAGRATGSSVTIPSVEGEEALARTYTFGVTYDVAGRVASTSYPQAGPLGAETVTSTYNYWGLPSTLTGMLNQVAQPYVSNTSYTPLGQLMRRFYGAGGQGDVRRFYTYEETTGRLSSAQAYHFTAVQNQRRILQWNSFVYDDIGNILRADERSGTVIDPQVPARDASECFRYDKLDRLTEAWTTLDTTCAASPAAGTAKGLEPYHGRDVHGDLAVADLPGGPGESRRGSRIWQSPAAPLDGLRHRAPPWPP
jgi:hypothetical protein